MKKMMILIILMVVIIILYGCKEEKPIPQISSLDMIRVRIIDLDEGEYYYAGVTESYEQRIDYNIFNVEVMERYNDLVEADSYLEYQKGDIIKMAVPASGKEDFNEYEEFLIYFPRSKKIHDYEKSHKYNYVEVEIFIEYATETLEKYSGITPINNNIIDVNNDKFDFNYINGFERYIDDEQLKFKNGLTIEKFEEWFKKVYESQMI